MGTCNPQAALSFERGVGSGQGRPPSHLGSGSKGPRSPGPALLIPGETQVTTTCPAQWQF